MKKTRHYDDPCGIARALDRVGERWALLVVRELMFGPKRFTDLREGLPSASPNVLSQRLDELAEDGVVQRRRLDPPARTWVYELTAWGRQLAPVLTALGRWGSRATPVPRGDLSTSALLVALQTTHEPRRANATPLLLELKLGDERYSVHMEHGTIAIASGAATKPDATLETDSASLRRVVFGDLSLVDAQENGALRVAGSARAAARFVESFRRPSPVALAELTAQR